MFGKTQINDPYNTMGRTAKPAKKSRGEMGADTSKRRKRHHWDDLSDQLGSRQLNAMLDQRERIRDAADRGQLTDEQYRKAKEQLRDRYDYDGPWEC